MPLGHPSYWMTRSHSPLGSMRKMRPKGVSTMYRFPLRSKAGPSRKHSTSACCRLGSDHEVRDFLRNLPGIDENTSALTSSSGLNGFSMAVDIRSRAEGKRRCEVSSHAVLAQVSPRRLGVVKC